MLREISIQSLIMGLLVAFVGFASSFAVIIHGLTAVGATEAQAASGLMALSVSMGVCAILLSVWTRLPVSIAWSTPGAALLASSGAVAGGYAAAAGGFILCAIMIMLAGLWRPLGRFVSLIPAPLANAMLAGVLLSLCFAPVKAVGADPALALPIVLAWAIAGRFNRLLAVPAALLAFALVVVFGIGIPQGSLDRIAATLVPRPELVMPAFTLQGLVSIALPLFVVTMASQNIPGIAVLRVHGYAPQPGPLFAATGLFSLFAVPFGGHTVNLAAITAAMCAGPDSHVDPDRRYWTAIIAGIVYIVFGLLAATVTLLVGFAPPVLIQAVAGLALIGAFATSAAAAFKDVESRNGAAITFLVTASGISFAGVSGAFWGLLAGGLMLLLEKSRPS
jgi:benzoate membrane transport protein